MAIAFLETLLSSFCAAIAVDMYYELGAALYLVESNEHEMDQSDLEEQCYDTGGIGIFGWIVYL